MIGPKRGRRFRLVGCCLLALLAAGAYAGDGSDDRSGTAGVDPRPAEPAPPADDALTLAETSATVTGALQGKEGVRIQTLCTHCNSANVQVGGLGQDLVPLSRDGYPIIGGLATSLVLSMLPADTIVEAQVVKGPGEASEPAPAAGGVISLTGAEPDELPALGFTAGRGSFSRRYGTLRLSGEATDWLSGSVTAGIDEADAVDDDRDGYNDVGEVDRTFVDARGMVSLGRADTVEVGFDYIEEDNRNARGAFDVLGFIADPAPRWTREDTFLDRRAYRAGWTHDFRAGGGITIRGLAADREQRLASQLTRDASGPFGASAAELFDRFLIEEANRWVGATVDRPIGLSWSVRGGVESSYQKVSAESINAFTLLLGGNPEPETASDRVEVQSAWADVGWTPASAVSLRLGVRYDDAELTHDEKQVGRIIANRQVDSQVSPRATLRWYPASGWTLRFLAGKTYRPPKPILSEVCCGQAYQDSSGTIPESGTSLGLETIFQPSPTWRASLYAARTDFDDHIVRLVAWSQLYIQTYALANVDQAAAETLELAARFTPGGAGGKLQLDASIGWLSFLNDGDTDVPVEVAPPSFGSTQTVIVPMDRVPYRPERTGSFSLGYLFPGDVQLSAGASYTGSMLIQEFAPAPTSGNMLLPSYRETPSFWLVSASVNIPLSKHLELALGVDNATDELQDDLGDPTTDYNWGPLSGRTYHAALHLRFGRGRS